MIETKNDQPAKAYMDGLAEEWPRRSKDAAFDKNEWLDAVLHDFAWSPCQARIEAIDENINKTRWQQVFGPGDIAAIERLEHEKAELEEFTMIPSRDGLESWLANRYRKGTSTALAHGEMARAMEEQHPPAPPSPPVAASESSNATGDPLPPTLAGTETVPHPDPTPDAPQPATSGEVLEQPRGENVPAGPTMPSRAEPVPPPPLAASEHGEDPTARRVRILARLKEDVDNEGWKGATSRVATQEGVSRQRIEGMMNDKGFPEGRVFMRTRHQI